jgi:hypothetical protein
LYQAVWLSPLDMAMVLCLPKTPPTPHESRLHPFSRQGLGSFVPHHDRRVTAQLIELHTADRAKLTPPSAHLLSSAKAVFLPFSPAAVDLLHRHMRSAQHLAVDFGRAVAVGIDPQARLANLLSTQSMVRLGSTGDRAIWRSGDC